MNGLIRKIGLAAWLALPLAGAAAEDEGLIDRGALVEQVDGSLEQATGFIVDRTVTNFGAVFLHDFALAWRAQGAPAAVDLAIVERPSARWGSTIFVEYKGQALARIFLQAGGSASIKPLAERAAEYMAGRVTEQSLAGLFGQDPDLAKEELP